MDMGINKQIWKIYIPPPKQYAAGLSPCISLSKIWGKARRLPTYQLSQTPHKKISYTVDKTFFNDCNQIRMNITRNKVNRNKMSQ